MNIPAEPSEPPLVPAPPGLLPLVPLPLVPPPDGLPFPILCAEPGDRAAIAEVLAASGLPALPGNDDIGAFTVVRRADGSLLGCAACERHGNQAVLRVVAVVPPAKGCGVGTALVSSILRQLIKAGVQSVALLAIGGQDFFSRFGFLRVVREDLPPEAAAIGQFDRADPQLACPMLLHLGGATLVGSASLADMPAVLAIYNDAVAQSTATYDYEPRTLDEQVAVFEQKMLDGYGFFVARTPDGTVAGFSTYGLYRTRPGWRFACEHSVYVAAPWRGRRVGLSLLAPVMRHARQRGFHTMVGVVDAENAASLRMHRRAGFIEIGTMREGGYKFDRWLDVALLQAIL